MSCGQRGAMPAELAENDEAAVTVIVLDADQIDERMALRLIPSRSNVFPPTFDFEEEDPNDGRLFIRLVSRICG